jgi:hypothetical protein
MLPFHFRVLAIASLVLVTVEAPLQNQPTISSQENAGRDGVLEIRALKPEQTGYAHLLAIFAIRKS